MERGGIYTSESDMIIANCTVSDNSADEGGGICFYGSTPTVSNCTVSGNFAASAGSGICCSPFSNIIIENTIVEGNIGSGGVHFDYSTNGSLTYGDFHNNPNGNFTGTVPFGLGVITGVNANGDSCDVFNNIFLAPLFHSTTGDSAFFLTENSPCIDAGDPASPLDPDGTIADIGAYYFDQSGTSVLKPDISIKPDRHSLLTPYPNPFNPSTVISFELRDASFVKLVIYDVQGRVISRLVDGFKPAGIYEAVFDGSELASGVYFARLTVGEFQAAQKLLLIR